MKAILMSIRPQHLVNILNGYKTLELRKTIPKDFKGWVYCYCTKSKPYYEPRINGITNQKMWNIHNDFIYHTDLNGKVVARFWFDDYDDIIYKENEYIWCNGKTLSDGLIGSFYLSKLKLSYEHIFNYGKGKDLYAWHIKKLEIFNKPKYLSEFIPFFENWKTYCHEDSDCENCPAFTKDMQCKRDIGLTKAPQSWMYVEAKE